MKERSACNSIVCIATTTAQKFLSQWCKDDDESHPALEVLKKLLKTSDLLSPTVCYL